MKGFILTEGSRNIGFGHVTRCLSLYQAFEERRIRLKFFVNGDDSIVELIENTDYKIINWIREDELILKEMEGADLAVIDSYLADKEFYENISRTVKVPVYIDDNKRVDYPRGIVVNGNIHATDLSYLTKEGVTYLLGTRYTPLRKEFWKVPKKEIKDRVKSIMVTFGGDDIRNMTPKVLKLLSENYPEVEKKVIIGKGFCNIDEIESVADENTNFVYYPNAEQMKQVMLDSDIAISAGGQTLYELARVGVPTIAVVVAQNQLRSVKKWKETGFLEYSGSWRDPGFHSKFFISIESMLSFQNRKRRSFIGRAQVDGKGALRIVDEVLKRLE